MQSSNGFRLVHLMDRVASSLEGKGLLKEAENLDVLSNTLDVAQEDKKSLTPEERVFLDKILQKISLPELEKMYDSEREDAIVKRLVDGDQKLLQALKSALPSDKIKVLDLSNTRNDPKASTNIRIDYPSGYGLSISRLVYPLDEHGKRQEHTKNARMGFYDIVAIDKTNHIVSLDFKDKKVPGFDGWGDTVLEPKEVVEAAKYLSQASPEEIENARVHR